MPFFHALCMSAADFNPMQLCLMHLLMDSDPNLPDYHTLAKNRVLTRGEQESNVCTWCGVKCVDRIVREFKWEHHVPPIQLQLEWFPNTVKYIDIANEHFKVPLHTRSLPKALGYCWMDRCGLKGSLELRTLPPVIEVLDLRNNTFRGAIYVANLPNTIRAIRLMNSEIETVFVMNADLPDSLKALEVNQRSDLLNFKKSSLKCLDGEHVDKRVHCGYCTKRI